MCLQHSISVQKAQKEISITLKAIKSLLYNCIESEKRQELHHLLKNVEVNFTASSR